MHGIQTNIKCQGHYTYSSFSFQRKKAWQNIDNVFEYRVVYKMCVEKSLTCSCIDNKSITNVSTPANSV